MKTTKEKFVEIDGRIKLVNQKIDLIIKNHLHHMKQDIDRILYSLGAIGLLVLGKPDFVVNIGDLLDFHAINMHTHDPDLYSAGHELKLSRKYVKELESIYPKMIEVESNHSSLVYRRALKYGMSKEFLKDYGDFLGTKKWKWVDDLTLDLPNKQRCFFTHGRSADVLKVSQTMGMSAVQGHYHTKFVISWWANPDNLFFAMNVGCLINQKSLAFAYAKNFKTRFILGCGIIIDGIPRLLPMVLNNKGNWIKKLV
jgi:hypothetical protein